LTSRAIHLPSSALRASWRDGNGVLIDARNRLAACKLAGVKPHFQPLAQDTDARDLILSENVKRRHLSKAQQAMATAMVYPEPEKGGRGKQKTVEDSSTLFSAKRLQQARSILHHSRSQADSVLKGITPLDAALTQMRQEQQAENSEEAQLAHLQKAA
jgi:hypothetical protein